MPSVPPRIQTGVRGGSIGLDSAKVWPVDWGSSGPAESPGARLQGPSGSSAKMTAVAARKHKLRTPAKPDPATRRGRRGVPVVAVAALILVAAGVWAYSPSFGGVFVLDDVRAIIQNPTIRTLWPLTTPLSPPSACTVAGRPVANLSFAINRALAPASVPEATAAPGVPGVPIAMNATAFHVGNLLIHLTAALLLFGVVRRTLMSQSLEAMFGVAAPWLALTIASVWVVHPLQTSAVTYIVQRVESLMGLFYLLTVYCAIRASAGSRVRLWTAGAVVSCA